MNIEVRNPSHPEEAKQYTTERLRQEYLINNLFGQDEVKLVYSHFDRMIVGSVVPVAGALTLEGGKELGSEYFLERRELGVLNIGAKGTIVLDGKAYPVEHLEAMYIGMGTKEIRFESEDSKNPAKFYLNSAPAHKTYPTVMIDYDKAKHIDLGSLKDSNERTIHQYIHPAVCQSCQLIMGITSLKEGSVWNTMPTHTHERRMEVYFYFDVPEEALVFHLMGRPEETRHLVVRREEAVISPSWSIHAGTGTTNYTFAWGMVGENQDFGDMDVLSMDALK